MVLKGLPSNNDDSWTKAFCVSAPPRKQEDEAIKAAEIERANWAAKKILLSCSLARQKFLKIFQIFGHLCLVLVFATCFQYVFRLPFLAIPICSDACCSLKPPAGKCILIASPAWHFCWSWRIKCFACPDLLFCCYSYFGLLVVLML